MVGLFSETLWLNLMVKKFTRLVKVTDEELIHLMKETGTKKREKKFNSVNNNNNNKVSCIFTADCSTPKFVHNSSKRSC